MDLQCFGYALRMRWLWMRRSEDNRPWHQLPDTHEPVVEAMFRASTYFELGDGHKALFWEDRWLEGRALSDIAPNLYTAVGPRTKKTRTVAQALQGDAWINVKYQGR